MPTRLESAPRRTRSSRSHCASSCSPAWRTGSTSARSALIISSRRTGPSRRSWQATNVTLVGDAIHAVAAYETGICFDPAQGIG
jgi:hypothetical protein